MAPLEPEERYIPNPTPALLKVSSPSNHLLTSLTKIVTSSPPLNPWPHTFQGRPTTSGIFAGPTSIAYLFLTLTKTHPSLLIANESPKYWCLAYLDCGQESRILEPAEWDPRSQCIGISNEFLAGRCVKAAVNQDKDLAEFVIKTIVETEVPKEENEHLCGRAGALCKRYLRICRGLRNRTTLQDCNLHYFPKAYHMIKILDNGMPSLLRFLKHWFPETASNVNAAIGPLIETMLENSNPWTYYSVQYLGAVHGDIGNLTQIILSDPSYAPKLEERLISLLDMQLPSGGWPMKDPSKGGGVRDLVHCCHGAPGFVLSLISIRQHFDYSSEIQQRIDVAVQKGREWIWERGILKKQPCLCHGVVGNALALPKGEQREHFMAFATEEMMAKHMTEGLYKEGDEPWGMFWGETGRAWGWLVLDCGVELGFPGYSDI